MDVFLWREVFLSGKRRNFIYGMVNTQILKNKIDQSFHREVHSEVKNKNHSDDEKTKNCATEDFLTIYIG